MEITTNTAQPTADKKGKALASLILGLVGLVAWFLPIIGLPVTITGLIMGILGKKSSHKGMAVAGIILSSIFLALTIANAALGAYFLTNALQK